MAQNESNGSRRLHTSNGKALKEIIEWYFGEKRNELIERYQKYKKNTSYSHKEILEKWKSLQEAFIFPKPLSGYMEEIFRFIQKYVPVYTTKMGIGMGADMTSGLDIISLNKVAEKKDLDAWSFEEYADYYVNCMMEHENKRNKQE